MIELFLVWSRVLIPLVYVETGRWIEAESSTGHMDVLKPRAIAGEDKFAHQLQIHGGK